MPDRFSFLGLTDAAQNGAQDKRKAGLSRSEPGTGVRRVGQKQRAFEADFPACPAGRNRRDREDAKNRF